MVTYVFSSQVLLFIPLFNLKCFSFTLLEFILECHTPLLLYMSTHLLILTQTIWFRCNPCLLHLMLYCELYASTLLCYSFSMRIHLYAFMPLHLYTSTPLQLYASTLLRLYASTPLHLCASTPLHLYASTPLRLYASTTLHFYASMPLHLCASTPLH